MFASMPHSSMAPTSAPQAVFGGPLMQDGPRGTGPFNSGMAGAHVIPAQGGLAQGQQPILNDALSYLDQVKVQFSEQPDVYNRFLDIMKDFKSQTIDTPGVISRVSELFAGHPNLIQGFNTFLPPGYRIECGLEDNPNSIRVTTPSGSTIHSIGQAGRGIQLDAPRNAHTPTPAAASAVLNGAAQQQANLEKRGPVEFNHAISYVNKIKNRFQDKPEIYKNFLEILQTYQREQKPIQEVYAQVTTLFNSAPDLLEDFKQFLPESAASARGGARPSEDLTMNNSNQTNQAARDGPKMPPVGNFAPPATAGKETKKRPRNDKQAPAPATATAEASISAVRGAPPPNSNKRIKTTHAKAGAVDIAGVEPSLTPVLPEPLAPNAESVALPEDFNFFDKVKKFLNNKTATTEFMKLCNLFSQDLVDKNVFIHKASQFIGGHHELFNYLKHLIKWNGMDETIENRPEPPTGRVSLSNCRGYGPSYRLLPKRERLKPCSGRDELCNSVLNDEWASHPTWASEDSGFVAHRKNGFEEGLHRIEEERHDYDFYIEANQKCIQLLEPIAQQMLTLSPAEREHFRMPPGLGGQSSSIYKRVLKKVYGAENGIQVVNDMFVHPFSVVPIVLARLKQKDEEWRFTQREWEKVWQSQTEAMYLKSLDHMGIQVKQNDKRNLSAKHLVDVIKTKHEEQRRARYVKGNARVPRFQFQYKFDDQDIILDLLRFMILYAMNSGQHGASEKERIIEFFETFIPQFFDLPDDKVHHKLGDIDRESGDDEADDAPPAELTNGRTSRRNAKKSDLLRGVLDPGRNGSRPRHQKEDSAASGSKETTPDVTSANEEDMPDAPEDNSVPEVSNDRWLSTVPMPTVVTGQNPLIDEDGELKADGFFRRPWYNFFCNQTIYVFFSVFQTLYKRLKEVKENTDSVAAEISRESADKPAKLLGLVHDDIKFFEGCDASTYWSRTAELIEDYIVGEIDENRYQDVLRHYYLKNGWTLYTIQDLLKTLCRLSLICNNNDSKEKTPDLIQQYLTSRQSEETSYQTEISARKYAEKCIKDGEMFVICWFPAKAEATVRWLQRDDTTFHMDEMELRERWQYYISSWTRAEPTEGINRSRLQKVVLARNLPANDAESDSGFAPKPLSFNEGLILKICLNTSKIIYEKGTSNYFIYNIAASTEEERAKHEERQKTLTDARNQRFYEKMIMNNAWMKDLSQEEVQKANEGYQKWKEDAVTPAHGDLAVGNE
ncbi:putative histone deacetylase complex protein [Phaeoacremonium minimum UCRPA7]|uniref:Putative histone deacetylase complex protein n=1 Tax=Phaeoacremonium minimum (strain UCR-PA7) TaxID=1286976 RepID=R8BMW8_PHAM7|nr:putative histone deacetylase complex protein [Phaeoacremonium minimum UCRPA7]EOO00743.1 putative histone deacetylase complex protein [Phaeoacremonium minimum UCRPA7]